MFIQTPEEFNAAQDQLLEYSDSDRKNPKDDRRFEYLITYMEAYILATTGSPSALFIMAGKTKNKSEEKCKKVITCFVTNQFRTH